MYYFWIHLFLIPLTFGTILSLKSFRLGWPLIYKVFSILLIVFWVTEVFAIAWKYWLFKIFTNNIVGDAYWIYNLSFFIQYFLIFLFFFHILKGKTLKNIVLGSAIAYYIFAIIDLLFIEHFRPMNTYSFALASTFVVILCVFYFNQLKNKEPVEKLYTIPSVWIVTGLFLYHATKYPFILGFKYLSGSLAFAAYNLYMALGCLYYILFSIAYLCKNTRQK